MHHSKRLSTPVLGQSVAVALALLTGLTVSAKSRYMYYSNLPGTGIVVSGGGPGETTTFSFSEDANSQNFRINLVFGPGGEKGATYGIGTAVEYKGSIQGTWVVGPVTNNPLDPNVQSASITGTGTFSIDDGHHLLTADLDWRRIRNSYSPIGAGNFSVGSIGQSSINGNLVGFLNVSNVSYDGFDPDLYNFSTALYQGAQLAFFIRRPGMTLTEIVNEGLENAAFQGTFTGIDTPDTGATLALLGLGFCGLTTLRHRTADQQVNRRVQK